MHSVFPQSGNNLEDRSLMGHTRWWLTVAGFYWNEMQTKAEVSSLKAELRPQSLLCTGQCLVLQKPPRQRVGVRAEHEQLGPHSHTMPQSPSSSRQLSKKAEKMLSEPQVTRESTQLSFSTGLGQGQGQLAL